VVGPPREVGETPLQYHPPALADAYQPWKYPGFPQVIYNRNWSAAWPHGPEATQWWLPEDYLPWSQPAGPAHRLRRPSGNAGMDLSSCQESPTAAIGR